MSILLIQLSTSSRDSTPQGGTPSCNVFLYTRHDSVSNFMTPKDRQTLKLVNKGKQTRKQKTNTQLHQSSTCARTRGKNPTQEQSMKKQRATVQPGPLQGQTRHPKHVQQHSEKQQRTNCSQGHLRCQTRHPKLHLFLLCIVFLRCLFRFLFLRVSCLLLVLVCFVFGGGTLQVQLVGVISNSEPARFVNLTNHSATLLRYVLWLWYGYMAEL